MSPPDVIRAFFAELSENEKVLLTVRLSFSISDELVRSGSDADQWLLRFLQDVPRHKAAFARCIWIIALLDLELHPNADDRTEAAHRAMFTEGITSPDPDE